MKINNLFKSAVLIILFIFSFEVVLFSPTVFPQSIYSVKSNIGGGGTSTPPDDSGNSDTYLYIVVGVIIIALLVWKVINDRKQPKAGDKESPDSTNVSLSTFPSNTFTDPELQLEKIQDQIPFEIFLGFQGNKETIPERSLTFGLKIRL
jgi:hypothetical protein